MSNNRTFFKNVQAGQMTLKDIFSDVLRKHTEEESARVFIAGTALTTPDDSEMLAGWQKPFLFARFFVICLVCMGLAVVLGKYNPSGTDALLIILALMPPVTVLLLAWEMNVPRSISLMEILKIVAVGGMVSLVITVLAQVAGVELRDASWAPMIEEPAKLAVVYVLLMRKNRKYILEGVLLGMAVGTGFAVIETLGYIMTATRNGMIISLASLVLNWAEQGGTDAAVNQLVSVINNQMSALNHTIYTDGAAYGINNAIMRGVNGIVGHGVYAALYSGGLMIAKGKKEVSPRCLFQLDFLIYFGASFLIHYLNNSPLTDGFPWLIEGKVLSWSLVKIALGACFLLPLMKKGVNQVVEITAGLNDGRVTLAVNREYEGIKGGSSDGTGRQGGGRIDFISGPLAGQSFPIRGSQPITIGRSPSCSIPVVGAGNVSGMHCSVDLNGSMILVTDLGSTNGTFIGSQKLTPRQPTPVPDGGVICLGNQNCAFRISIG